MQLDSGAHLGPYTVLGHVGSGGMGEVYQARDTRLDRVVAIKVLSSTQVLDPERRRRFFQEARAASALNHPSIVTVYDIGAATVGATTLDYLVMEYLSGTTLEQIIHGRAVGVEEALKYGAQIADALAAAHRAGIVHRDLKPSNVIVTERGLVKVLDFGVAKLGEGVVRSEFQDRVTVDAPAATMEGVIVGTVAYMSPEQAEGRKVDGRSDIFSFGVLMYELLTGRRPFAGTSRMSTLAAILERDYPPLIDTLPGIPPELDRVVGRCLRKDPERRFQHMDDVRVALEELRDESVSGRLAAGPARTARVDVRTDTPPAAPRSSGRDRRLLVAGGTLAIALLVVVVAISLWRVPAPARPFNPILHRLTSDAGLTAFPALSPDGTLLAYASDRVEDGGLDIWVEQLGSGQPLRLTNDPADDFEPVFSPDGTRIAFRSERSPAGIYVVAALGGDLRLVAPNGRRPRFSPDGGSIAYWVGAIGWLPGSSSTYVVPAGGGQPRRIAPTFAAARHPIWTPDGKLLFVGHPGSALSEPEIADWWLAPVDGGAPVKTHAFDAFRAQGLSVPLLEPVMIPDGWLGDRIVFSAGTGDTTNVWAIPVSPTTGGVTGTAERLTQGTSIEMSASVAAGPAGVKLAFAGLSSNVDVWSTPMNHRLGQPAGPPERLTDRTGFDGYPSVSADGTKLVYVSQRASTWDIVLRDLTTARDRVLVTVASATAVPQISADGSTVAYWDKGRLEGFVMPAAGGPAEKVCTDCGPPTHLSADGRKVVIEGALLVDRERHQPSPLAVPTEHPDYVLFGGRLSPDGRWVSFHARTGSSEHRQIFVAPVHDAASAGEREWIPITDGSMADRESVWSPDGRALYFLSDRDGFRCIWAQRLDIASRRPIGAPFPVFHAHHARRTLTRVAGGPAAIGLSVTHDRLLFAQSELTGNVWASSWSEEER